MRGSALWRTAAQIALLAFWSLSLSGCQVIDLFSTPTPTPAPPPQTSRPGVTMVSAEGVVVPIKKAELAFEISGRVEQVLVEEGDTVEAGQVIARLEAADAQQRVNEGQAALRIALAELARLRAGAREEEISVARGQVSAAQANLEVSWADLAAARAELARLEAGPKTEEIAAAKAVMKKAEAVLKLAQDEYDKIAWASAVGASPQAVALEQATLDYENAKAQYEALVRGATEEELDIVRAAVQKARAAVKVAEAQVEQAQAHLDLLEAGPSSEEIAVAQARVDQAQRALEGAQTALDKTILTAPFAGTIGHLAVEEGEVVTVVGNVTPVVTIGDLRRLRVETDDLSEVDIARIEIEQRVEIEVDALPDTELHGRVVEIAPMATVQQGDTVYTVTIDLEEGLETGLKWGMTAYVDIVVEEEEGS